MVEGGGWRGCGRRKTKETFTTNEKWRIKSMEQLIFRRFAVFCLLSIKIGENVGVHDGHSREFSGK